MHILPQFNPIAVAIGPVAIHWYAISYIVGFVLFLQLGRHRIRQGKALWNEKQMDDFFTYAVLGVILGGRLGYVFFYQAEYYLSHPAMILRIWEGGMSFHGGLIGVIIAMLLFAKHQRLSFWDLADTVAPLVPLGLASGRIGNFINGELWGRVTAADAFWAAGFPTAAHADKLRVVTGNLSADALAAYAQYGMLPRHISSLYESFLEGIVLFIVLWWFSSKPRPRGQVAALFFIGYGVARFIVEFAREPDEFLGLLSLGLSMGQWLCVPMIALGLWLWHYGKRPAKTY